jgi:hypothetical protein
VPYSEVRRERSSKSTSKPRCASIARAAICARRQVFDISPGQVWSLRAEPLMTRMRERLRRFRWRRSAFWIAARVASHSRGSWKSGSAKAAPARRVRGDLRYSW